jgi:hypothetical protein
VTAELHFSVTVRDKIRKNSRKTGREAILPPHTDFLAELDTAKKSSTIAENFILPVAVDIVTIILEESTARHI